MHSSSVSSLYSITIISVICESVGEKTPALVHNFNSHIDRNFLPAYERASKYNDNNITTSSSMDNISQICPTIVIQSSNFIL